MPLHESALGIELLLALLIILGVRQPLSGPTPLSISAATVVAGAGAEAHKGEGATLVWTSPRGGADTKWREKMKMKKGQVRAWAGLAVYVCVRVCFSEWPPSDST